MISGNILIYDAECRLCLTSKRWIEKWDHRRQIVFIPFQDEAARQLIPELAAQPCMDAMRFVDAMGRVFVGASAARAMLPLFPMGRIIAPLFLIPGVPWIAHWVYIKIAANRYRLFGST